MLIKAYFGLITCVVIIEFTTQSLSHLQRTIENFQSNEQGIDCARPTDQYEYDGHIGQCDSD